MRWSANMQPVTTVPGSETIQEVRYAVRLGHAKSGVALVNVYRNLSSSAVSFALETASHTALRLDTTSSPFWFVVGSGSMAASTTGMVRIPIADLGEVVRWHATNQNGSVDFSILLRLYDRDPE